MRILFTILSIHLVLVCYAGKISGTVTDKDGKALSYASISIKGTTRGTNANNEGKYFLHLEPGQYTLVCQYVGYKKEEKTITVGNVDIEINFTLILQEMVLPNVVIQKGEDPAYEIIRQTIKKRTYYKDQFNKFKCEVYTKGQLRIRDYPKKIFGQKIDFEDGDTSKQKMLYLSETISLYSVDKPNKEKIEVISSKVSGQSDGYGLSAPQFFSFYDNNIFIGNNLNPRGFISPISDNAINYYRYKFEGEFIEDGRHINKIKVIPRRKYEPLFSGYIDIVDDEWRIHSLQLWLTKQSQMELIDSLRLEQLYMPVSRDVWAISSQVIYPSIKILGFDAYGSFVNIYSNFDIAPQFDKKVFNNTILKYTDSSNKKSNEYWEAARPVPLQAEEINDYYKKDSLEQLKKDPHYMDSLDKVRNKVTVMGAMLFGQTFFQDNKRTTLTVKPLTEQLSFNTVEGFVISTGVVWTKRLDDKIGGRSIAIDPSIRYGFSNKHLTAHIGYEYHFGSKYLSSFKVSVGKRIFQFNNLSPITARSNTLATLISEKNLIKIYEAWYVRGSYTSGIGSGFTWLATIQYQDRTPLENTTDYTWRNHKDRMFTPNYPSDLVDHNISRHQSLSVLVGLTWQPHTRYIELPDRKINIGSKYPVFSLQYIQGINKIFGSDVDYARWRFGMTHSFNFRLRGQLNYRFGMGGFFDTTKVQIPDYQHLNGNISTFATEYLNSFQVLPIYQYSNLSKFYVLGHIEYHLNGFLTNKIPLFRKLNWHLVAGANAFHVNNTDYQEYLIGFENIFKRIRIDFVSSTIDGKKGKNAIRIGIGKTQRTYEDRF